MDNCAVIHEFPGDARVVFSHIHFGPAGFSGIKERVFGASGAVDLPTTMFHELGKRGGVKLDGPGEGENSAFKSLEASFANARDQKDPLNNGDSALRSVLVAMTGAESDPREADRHLGRVGCRAA